MLFGSQICLEGLHNYNEAVAQVISIWCMSPIPIAFSVSKNNKSIYRFQMRFYNISSTFFYTILTCTQVAILNSAVKGINLFRRN